MANKLAYVVKQKETMPHVLVYNGHSACDDPVLEIPILYGDVDTAKDIAETLIALEA